MARRGGTLAGHGPWWTIVVLAILFAGPSPEAVAREGASGDRALREERGRVAETQVARDADGAEWTDAVVESDSGERLAIRLAPPAALEKAGFTLSAGDAIRVRFFTEPVPYPVQKIRNETTRRDLRLRCLHGEPLWDAPGRDSREGGRYRYRGGRGDEWRGGKRRGSP